MLADLLHPLPVEVLDRYTQLIYGQLKCRRNRPATLRHLETLLKHEAAYLAALDGLLHRGQHYAALAGLPDDELAALDLRYEHAHQAAVVAELTDWRQLLLAVVVGDAEDEALAELAARVEALYYVS